MKPEIANWSEQGKRDLQTARHSFQSRDFYASVFWCQQAVEKGLKALYMKSFGELWRIHDLVKLAREVNAPEEIIFKCAQLNPIYVVVRYPESDELPAEKVKKADAEQMILFAVEVLRWVAKKL